MRTVTVRNRDEYEAVQFDPRDWQEIEAWSQGAVRAIFDTLDKRLPYCMMIVPKDYYVMPLQWIIRSRDDEYVTVTDSEFRSEFEVV